jgi:hypothetical protein
VLGYGLHELYNTYQANFEEHLKLDQMNNRVESWMIVQGGRFGLVTTGIVIGWQVIKERSGGRNIAYRDRDNRPPILHRGVNSRAAAAGGSN